MKKNNYIKKKLVIYSRNSLDTIYRKEYTERKLYIKVSK